MKRMKRTESSKNSLRQTLPVTLALLALASLPIQAAPANNDSARWENDIRAFEAADAKNPPPKGAVLFAGSSSTRKWQTLARDFPDLTTINRGFGGSQIADSTAFADRIIIPCRPRWIVLYAGDNDIAAGKSPRQVYQDFLAFVEKIHSSLPDCRIAFISIKPSLARWNLHEKMKEANDLVEDYCRRHEGFEFVNVYQAMLNADGKPRPELFVQDGLHMSRTGYELWTSLVRPRLNPK